MNSEEWVQVGQQDLTGETEKIRRGNYSVHILMPTK